MIEETKYVLTSEDGKFVSQRMHTPVLVAVKALTYTFSEKEANELKPAYEAALGVKLKLEPFAPPFRFAFERRDS